MRHLGDISKVNGAEIEPVDVITFGSPCQDLSVAGKRAGLKHADNGDEETTRSGLFMEAVRIIKEMREATNGIYPRFALWENVPGAFSSNKGEDFRTVLQELIQIIEPAAVMPAVPKNGWAYADSYCGDGWSIAYRVFDAQYWGVPQRRRRIYLVVDLAGQCARNVLFEREGVRGYFETGRTPWQRIASAPQVGPGATDSDHIPIVFDKEVYNSGKNATGGHYISNKVSPSLRSTANPVGVCANQIVRRLMPTECARLQGFPDNWGSIEEKVSFTPEEYAFWLEVRNTHAAINGKAVKEYTEKQMLTWYNKLHTDSAEYKMWGNGIALPPALYCMQGIADALGGAAK
jgi:DNA (cytosine-5)-methyltransferase 1